MSSAFLFAQVEDSPGYQRTQLEIQQKCKDGKGSIDIKDGVFEGTCLNGYTPYRYYSKVFKEEFPDLSREEVAKYKDLHQISKDDMESEYAKKLIATGIHPSEKAELSNMSDLMFSTIVKTKYDAHLKGLSYQQDRKKYLETALAEIEKYDGANNSLEAAKLKIEKEIEDADKLIAYHKGENALGPNFSKCPKYSNVELTHTGNNILLLGSENSDEKISIVCEDPKDSEKQFQTNITAIQEYYTKENPNIAEIVWKKIGKEVTFEEDTSQDIARDITPMYKSHFNRRKIAFLSNKFLEGEKVFQENSAALLAFDNKAAKATEKAVKQYSPNFSNTTNIDNSVVNNQNNQLQTEQSAETQHQVKDDAAAKIGFDFAAVALTDQTDPSTTAFVGVNAKNPETQAEAEAEATFREPAQDEKKIEEVKKSSSQIEYEKLYKDGQGQNINLVSKKQLSEWELPQEQEDIFRQKIVDQLPTQETQSTYHHQIPCRATDDGIADFTTRWEDNHLYVLCAKSQNNDELEIDFTEGYLERYREMKASHVETMLRAGKVDYDKEQKKLYAAQRAQKKADKIQKKIAKNCINAEGTIEDRKVVCPKGFTPLHWYNHFLKKSILFGSNSIEDLTAKQIKKLNVVLTPEQLKEIANGFAEIFNEVFSQFNIEPCPNGFTFHNETSQMTVKCGDEEITVPAKLLERYEDLYTAKVKEILEQGKKDKKEGVLQEFVPEVDEVAKSNTEEIVAEFALEKAPVGPLAIPNEENQESELLPSVERQKEILDYMASQLGAGEQGAGTIAETSTAPALTEIAPEELEKLCLDAITELFSGNGEGENALSPEVMQAFLKIQGELTLHRLAWAFVTNAKKDDGKVTEKKLESTILRLLQEKYDSNTGSAEYNEQLKKAREDFDNKQLSRKSLGNVAPYLVDIVAAQKNEDGSNLPYLLDNSDVKMLALLGEKEESALFTKKEEKYKASSILNFAKIINSSYFRHGPNKGLAEGMETNKLAPQEVIDDNIRHLEKRMELLQGQLNEQIAKMPTPSQCSAEALGEAYCPECAGTEGYTIDKLIQFSDKIRDKVYEGVKSNNAEEVYKNLQEGDFWLHIIDRTKQPELPPVGGGDDNGGDTPTLPPTIPPIDSSLPGYNNSSNIDVHINNTIINNQYGIFNKKD